MKKKSIIALSIILIICILAFLFLQKKTIVVAADNIFEEVFTETVLDEFHKQNSRIKLQIQYGSSAEIMQKIENGERIDLFLSAVESEMDTLKSKGLVDADLVTRLWTDNVVLILPADNQTLKVADISSISRLAICHPDRVRSGADAREVLKQAGMWDTIRKNLVFATSEPEVLNFVANGKVDAGIVYGSTAVSAGNKVIVADVVPNGELKGAIFSAGIVHSSKESGRAQTFINYLKSDIVKQALLEQGFTPVE